MLFRSASFWTRSLLLPATPSRSPLRSALKVLDHDINRLGVVLDEIAAAAGDSVKVTVTVSADEAALPHDVKKYL